MTAPMFDPDDVLTDDGEQTEVALSNALSLPEVMDQVRYVNAVIVPDVAEALEYDAEGLALLLRDWLNLIDEMKESARVFELALYEALILPKQVIPGLGEVERSNSASRTQWQHADLMSKVVSVIADELVLFDEETGAIRDEASIVREVLTDFSKVNGYAWKPGRKQTEKVAATGLREFDLDPDEYCSTVWKKTVRLPKGEVKEDE